MKGWMKMFEKITPEKAGISSNNVLSFLKTLEKRGLCTHSILLMKGEDIFAEFYWKPFHKDFNHRMYSQTKSYEAIAIGLLEEEGKLKLDDKMSEHFPEKYDRELPEYLREQTICEMLTMTTVGHPENWFKASEPDRTRLYFESNDSKRPAGTIWEYDSAGSQVLSSLCEKLSGKSLLDYLKEKLFNRMGTFQNAEILKTRNGDSWGDSALLCTPRDMASFGRLLMNGGKWQGESLINEAFVKEATSALVCNNKFGFSEGYSWGYGYQIWGLPDGGFSFNGMGAQLTLCHPSKDLIFVITSDNQGYSGAKDNILTAFYDHIFDNIGEELPEDKEALEELTRFGEALKLRAFEGRKETSFSRELSGNKYVCLENPMGISEFGFDFSEEEALFRYKNAQGEKEMKIGINKNLFGKFPQLGYSNDVGGARTDDGFMYDCAFSGAFVEDKKFAFRAQIIDRYFGNLFVVAAFKDDYCVLKMAKTAEDFLEEYDGIAVGKLLK